MKTLVRILALSALAASLVGFRGDQASADLQRRVNAEMTKYVAALKKKDAKTCEAILRANFAPDYKATDLKGKVTGLEDMISQEKMHIAMIKNVQSATLKVSNVKINGDRATAKGHFVMNATVGDQKTPSAIHKLHVSSSWDANFRKKSGKWWVQSDKTTSEKVTMDGKPLP